MNTQPYIFEVGQDGVAVLSMDRAKQLNSVNYEAAEAMANVLEEIAARADLRVLIIRGNGPAFCAGGDVASMNQQTDLPDFASRLIAQINRGILAIHRMRIPVIASVHGSAAGYGFSLAMACDLVVATKSTRFFVAYLKLATVPDGGLSYTLTQRIGSSRALDLMLLRDMLKAEEAHSLGLVNYLADDDKIQEVTMEIAQKIAKLPKAAVSEYKALVSAVGAAELEQQLERERAAWIRSAGTDEIRARIKMFVEKNK